MCSPVRLPFASSAPTSLHWVIGMIAPVQHVLFARPDQLDRRARHLLGDQHRLADVSRGWSRAGRSRRRDDGGRPRTCRSAGRRPAAAVASAASAFCVAVQTSHLSRRSRAPWRSSAPWWRGAGRDSRRPPRPSCAAPAMRRLDVAGLVADEGLARPSRPSFSIAAMSSLDSLAFGPSSHSIGRASSAVLARHQVSATTATRVVADRHDLLDARHALDLGGVEALQLAAEDRAVLDRGVEHAGQLHVDAVDLLAVQLVGGVEPLHAACRRSSSPSDP